MTTIREAVWKLRTDPFYPDVDRDGNQLARLAFEKALNPLLDQRVMSLYFDVYDWSRSDLVRELSHEHALVKFPTTRSLPGSGMMFLISGASDTGTDSLANLILHKIRLTEGGKLPLLVDLALEGREKSRNVLAVAQKIITVIRFGDSGIPSPDRATLGTTMQTEYDRVAKAQAGKKDAIYGELFDIFHMLLKPYDQPLVVKISGGGDHDSWIRILESVKSCCSYVIVVTQDLPYAKTCYDAMIGNRLNIAWVQTCELDRAKAEAYVRHRLSCERAGLAADILPFTSEAFAALYEPGVVNTSSKVKYTVGWLRRGLYGVLNARMDELDRLHARADAATLEKIDVTTTLIGRNELIRFKDVFNRRA